VTISNEKPVREERFRVLFETAYPALRRYATNRGLSEADADDLVASTLEVAWTHLDDVPAIEPMPWLFAVARNHLRNRRRTNARRSELIALAPPAAAPVDSTATAVVGPAAIRNALEQLDEEDQEILRLVAWDGLTPAQAAAVLGCGAIAARSRLHRARNRLAKWLEFDPRVQREEPSGQIQSDRNALNTPTEVP
jgi:RNA polymerase sigma-70 factor (ECF subfamily)